MQLLKAVRTTILGILFLVMGNESLYAQKTTEVQWLTFEQPEDSLKVQPKKVFVDFVADWCTYCRKMDRVVFTDTQVINLLATKYYAVRMNIESRDTIEFGGTRFVNPNARKVNPVHQIALLMASREGKPFSLPTMVLLDETFTAQARYFQYLNPTQLVEALKKSY